ncbi:MAG: hypothetical protein ACH37Z_14670 [Anaerolineae bacterium]
MPLQPGPPPDAAVPALRVWNTLGGLEWAGLETAAALVGIEDIETLVAQLVVIRDWQRERDAPED